MTSWTSETLGIFEDVSYSPSSFFVHGRLGIWDSEDLFHLLFGRGGAGLSHPRDPLWPRILQPLFTRMDRPRIQIEGLVSFWSEAWDVSRLQGACYAGRDTSRLSTPSHDSPPLSQKIPFNRIFNFYFMCGLGSTGHAIAPDKGRTRKTDRDTSNVNRKNRDRESLCRHTLVAGDSLFL